MFYLKQKNQNNYPDFHIFVNWVLHRRTTFWGDFGGLFFFVFKDFVVRYNVFELYNKIINSKVLLVEKLYKPPESCSARQRLQPFFVKMGTLLYTCNVFYFSTFTPYCSFSHIWILCRLVLPLRVSREMLSVTKQMQQLVEGDLAQAPMKISTGNWRCTHDFHSHFKG